MFQKVFGRVWETFFLKKGFPQKTLFSQKGLFYRIYYV